MLIEVVRESTDKLQKQRWVFASGKDTLHFTLQRYSECTRETRRHHYKPAVNGGGWIPKPTDVMEEARQQVIEMIVIR